uniref:Nudix hydrolase domain-containing protein n=1 Tax=viral metagenome TaxID=1070528 RepID=A0A6C0BKM0_9ZZZZ
MSLTRKIKRLFKLDKGESYERLVNVEVSHPEKYKAAGSVFTDGKIILAGYQPRKKKPFISGIGGKKEEGETYMYTALRETVEELFEYESIPRILIEELKTIVPEKVLQNGSYIIVVYNFEDLGMMLKIIGKHKLRSPLYDTFPKNLIELIFNRRVIYDVNNVFYKPEISHLSLLPLIEHSRSNPFVDGDFIEDMPILMKSHWR